MTNFKKIAIASGVAAALTGASLPSHANMLGVAGEALLVPFVLYSNPNTGFELLNLAEPSINTLISVTTPSAVGRDTIPNFYTAPNSTPTNPGPPVTEEIDPDLGAEADGQPEDYEAAIHLYFFDEKSEERFNTTLPVSPDDLTLINWGDMVQKQKPSLNGVKGYIVITTQKARGKWREAAKFSMFGDAYMIWPTNIGLIDSKIPVLPMSDGADTAGDTQPTIRNNVIHSSTGAILEASPLASGMRTSLANGVGGDYTLFDLTMSNRFLPTLHVIWVDENIGQSNIGYVFNDVEQSCSEPLPITNELNVYWTSIPQLFPGEECLINPFDNQPIMQQDDPNTEEDESEECVPGLVADLPWVDAAFELCYPEGKFKIGLDLLNSDIFYPGFVRFQIDEYKDNGKGVPTSAAVAFSIQMQVDVIDAERRNLIAIGVLPTLLPVETSLGHERGQFNSDE
jgi:hypothetical protein